MDKSIEQFINKLKKDNVNLFNVDDVNNYINNLKVKDSTKRMYVYAIEKFYEISGLTDIKNKLCKYKQEKNLELTALEFNQIQDIKRWLFKTDQQLYVVFSILLETGMRLGEFMNTDWNQVKENKIIVKTIKNEDEYRYVFISDETLSLIHKYDGWKSWNRGTIQNKFTALSKSLDMNISCHTLRRTTGTLMKMNNVAIDDIANYLGHKNLNNTRFYYIKTNEQYQFSTAKKGWLKPLDNVENESLISEIDLLRKENELLRLEIKRLKDNIKELEHEINCRPLI